MIVYPRIGHLTRRWFQIQRHATENRQGQRHDRSAQQVEYHGLRRLPLGRQPTVDPLANVGPPRRAHGQGVRASERAGPGDTDRPMAASRPVRPGSRGKPSNRQSRLRPRCASRLPGIRDDGSFLAGPGLPRACGKDPRRSSYCTSFSNSSPSMVPVNEGGLAELFDVMPPAALREALLVIVSTRPINLIEEAERSSRFSGTSARGLLGRVMMLNATQGDLSSLFQFDDDTARDLLQQRQSSAIKDRRSSEVERRRGLSGGDGGPEASQATFDDGDNQP